MRKVFVALFLLFAPFVRAQDTVLLSDAQLEKAKVYTSLEEALKTPEKVIVLDLSGQGLTALPEAVLQFKNLQVLKLGYKIKTSTPKRVIRQSKKVGGGIVHLDHLEGKYLDYNHIKRLPEGIKNLEKLQRVYLFYNDFAEVPFELAGLQQVKYINLVGCYGLLKREDDLRALKAMLPGDCVLRTDSRLE